MTPTSQSRSVTLPSWLAFAAALCLCCLLPEPAHARALAQRDPAFEQQIARELEAVAPDAVPIFRQATAAWDSRDAASALDLYSRVLERAPGFSHAERRKCVALVQLRRFAEGLPLCRAALAQDDSPPNQAALAMSLLAMAGDTGEALALAVRASSAKPDDPYYWSVLAQAAFTAGDVPTARRASERLLKVAPEEPMTSFYAAVVAAQDGDTDRAAALVARAKADGLPPEMAASMAEAIEKDRSPWWVRVVKGLGRAVVAWFALLVALLGAGYALSYATLRAVAQRPTEAHVRPAERRLRETYRAVLWCACAYYYASLPLLAVVVVATTAGVIFAVIATGFIAPKLFIILAIIAFGSLAAIAKSVFVRPRDVDPGVVIDLAANPRMRAALDEVAARIGTRPVDRVFVTPFTEVAVFDRGSLGAQLRGRSDRCLVLGVGVLGGMRLGAFKSILAHEYGHFHNEDTAGGGFALGVRRSLFAMTKQLVARRAASALNPAWWFVRGFWRAFLGISQGASRLQEVLADRWAAFAYGSRAFEEGLRHVVQRTVRFDVHVSATIDEVLKTKAALPNLYAFAPAAAVKEGEIDEAIAGAFSKKPTPFDSHPCPEDRLGWVRELAFEGVVVPGDEAEAWSLFADRAAIESQMTTEVRARLQANRGVVVPGT